MIQENIESLQMAVDISKSQKFFEIDIGSFTLRKMDGIFQVDEFAEKGVSERGGGFVELTCLVNAEGIPVANPTTDERTNNSKATSNECQFVGTKVQFWSSLFFGGLFGAIIGVIILKIIFRFYT